MCIEMICAAKKLIARTDTFTYGQMYATVRATYHILGNLLFFFRHIPAIGFEQQVDHCGDGKQKYQTTHVNSVAVNSFVKSAKLLVLPRSGKVRQFD